ncbi:RNI-like protein [Conidiobolus coronatus NRRL 28638]|uniref:RNI-like protein n=1 Tax=Conidiobolus coronatus (strain ATCC 28846 / CBS 209.66 / NRRL 28638) TaxID=796925 RepID=A0A137NT10_CONC2|nr:RNI-like protein [Conidiobolus coronatus NRRL 28638]|eukprot:KXN65881.1 RNI-like protein [Conidiobolus coronatus NRRL 28638]
MNTLNILDPQATMNLLPSPPTGERIIAMYLRNYSIFDLVKSGDLDALTLEDLHNLAIHLRHLKTFQPLKTLSFRGYINTRLAKLLNYLLTERIFGVEVLDLNRCSFAKDTIKLIFSNLGSVQNINTIKLSRTSIKDKELVLISQALFNYTQITTKGLLYLFKVLNSKKVANLSLVGNQLGKELGDQLQKFLYSNRFLTKLDISINRVGGTGIDRIGTGLIFNNNLTHLNLVQNSLNDQACHRLASCLEHNTGVTHLNLSYNVIGSEGLESIANMLKMNTNIKYIDLQHCGLNTDCGRSLGSVLRVNRTLRGMDISKNRLGNDGIWFLADGLQVNQSLYTLDIEQNQISNEGFLRLIGSIKFHPSLQNLNVKGLASLLSPSNQDLLVDAIEHNTNLKSLGIDYNFTNWELIYGRICKQFTKNFTTDHFTIKATETALYYTRCLFLTKSPKSRKLEPVLPNELLFEILKQFDPHSKLNSDCWRKIVKFGLDKGTIGSSKEYYLSQILDDKKMSAYKFGEESRDDY